MKFFKENGISHPGLVDGDVIRAYLLWRRENGACSNTAIMEIGFLTTMLDYACDEEHWIPSNPAQSKWLKRELAAAKEPVKHAKP